MSETYTCAVCEETFDTGWSEEEAAAELARRFPGVPVAACDPVCDDCDKLLLTENRERTAAQLAAAAIRATLEGDLEKRSRIERMSARLKRAWSIMA